jgi:hypothetical protein
LKGQSVMKTSLRNVSTGYAMLTREDLLSLMSVEKNIKKRILKILFQESLSKQRIKKKSLESLFFANNLIMIIVRKVKRLWRFPLFDF